MKKVKASILIVLLSFGVFSAIAQDTNPLRIGVKGGVNFSNFRVDEVADNNVKVGLNLGLFAKLPVSDAFSLQPELLYSSKGSKLAYDNFLMGEGEYRFNFNYLELPVLAVFNIGEHFNIHVGPYVGYLANVNIKELDGDGSIQDIADLKEDDFNRFDYGLAGGIGVDFNGFIAGVRYSYGLADVGKSGKIAGEFVDDSKNSAATIYIGFGF